MKDIKQFLNEAKEYTSDTKVRMGDSAELGNFLKNEIENLDGTIKITGDGIKYNNILVPGTKLSLGLTAGEYADKLVDWINDYNEKRDKANEKVVVKKTRKNAGIPRGNYGAKERMDKRAEDRNNDILNGNWNPSAYEK